MTQTTGAPNIAHAKGWLQLPERTVPRELVLTSREALAFGYGLAVAGARTETRAAFAARKWGWDV